MLVSQILQQYQDQLDSELIRFISFVKKRLRMNWDLVIGITAEEGAGKSNLGIWLGGLTEDNFNLINNIAYIPSSKDIKDKFNLLKEYSVFDVDEAVKSFHKYQWMSKVQQTIVEMYATERKQKKCTLVLMPRFKDFTENFRNHRIKIWTHIIYRSFKQDKAHAIVYLRDDDKDAPDPWHFKENLKKKIKCGFFKKNITERRLTDILDIERRLPNYLFDFEFPPLPKEVENKYLELNKLARIQEHDIKITETPGQRATLWREKTAKLLMAYKRLNPNVRQDQLAKLSGISQAKISVMLKEMKDPEEKKE